MPRFRVTVPVYVFVTYEVEADDEDEAREIDAPGVPYDDVGGGISPPRGMRVRWGTAWDQADWDNVDIEELP